MSPRIRIAIVCLSFALCLCSASAQLVVDKNRSLTTPDQRFGMGLNNAGLHLQYAMGPAFHIGMNLNLDVNRLDGASQNIYHFGPYGKFLFSGSLFKPYVLAAVGVINPGTGKLGIQGRTMMPDSFYVKLPDPELSVKLAMGGEYFFSAHVGVYGHVNLFHLIVHPTPNDMNVGLIGSVVGVEFFF